MRLIGSWCKHSDVFSLRVLIGRGLDLKTFWLCCLCLFLNFPYLVLSEFLFTLLNGVYGDEVTPVPFPNTVVKLPRAFRHLTGDGLVTGGHAD